MRNANPARPSFVCSVAAREGGGKTNFALSAPKPIAYFSVDPNTQAVVDKVKPEGVTLHRLSYPTMVFAKAEEVKAEAAATWDSFVELLRPIVYRNSPKSPTPFPASVVIDTASEFVELNQIAVMGRLDQIKPETRKNMMGPVNSRWKGVVRALQESGVNVVLLHRVKDRYVDSLDSKGNEVSKRVAGLFAFDRVAFKELGNIISVEVALAHNPDVEGKLSDQFGMRITRSTLRPGLIGTEYWGRLEGSKLHTASFAHLASLVYPTTSVDDWR